VCASDAPANENGHKFCSQQDLGKGCWPEIGQFEIKFYCYLVDADIRQWHMHDRLAHGTAGSALVVMATATAGSQLC